MDAETETLALAIGRRVRDERQARDWTLDRLAAEAGVSRRMIVNVEQGAVNPSVGTLLRLSDALGIGLPALVEPRAVASDLVKVTRHGAGAALWSGERGGRGVLVAGTETPDVVELWDWTLEPGERHASEAHSTGTRELLQVLDGELVIEVGDATHALAVGDALTFPGDVDHAYANTADRPARFSLAVFEPGVGTTHREAGS
ncbi:XRE family transcriptional regulator [Agromyces sp. S2-1-8]|uniref:helix-turn-helix domain-containing protein n=1 Tax=Agromyces sp. S2-1-8 TaxID=2897180 RepID=UPI001E5F6401|nr:XRE family transcriptional regulator [Agromyces sp. S2-1-8]MCD5345820.1 XRE family transcriptional regulator [Agromyces sp. S2-1-8]